MCSSDLVVMVVEDDFLTTDKCSEEWDFVNANTFSGARSSGVNTTLVPVFLSTS